MATNVSKDDVNSSNIAGNVRDSATSATPRASTDFGQDMLNSIQSISQQPVEMSDLSVKTPTLPQFSDAVVIKDTDIEESNNGSRKINAAQGSSQNMSNRPLERHVEVEEAVTVIDSGIGPATDKPNIQQSIPKSGAHLVITLLMHSTETRHPYTIDESYLKRRNVNVEDNNPINMTVYTLKELILRDWRSEWESKPISPTSIRLIHMGRMLDDKSHLKDSRFSNGDTPHIVHMTIKPQEAIDEEDARISKGNTRDRDGIDRSPGCRCLIM